MDQSEVASTRVKRKGSCYWSDDCSVVREDGKITREVMYRQSAPVRRTK